MHTDRGQPSTSKLDDLHEIDWIPVPDHSYFLKYVINDSKYNILVSNFTCVFGEEMNDTDIEARFIKLNPHVKMKPRVILEYLNKSLKEGLFGESNLVLKLEDNKMTITLDFHACHAACKYDIAMTLMPAEKLMHYIIQPIILGSLLSQKKVAVLQKNTEKETRAASFSKTNSSISAIDPEWLKGKNVPFQFVCDSFLSIQKHFKELYSENNEAYISCKEIREDNETKAHSVIHHKKVKLTEIYMEESNLKFEEEGSDMIKEEESNSEVLSQVPKDITKRKKEKKFFKI